MPLQKRWSEFSKENIECESDTYGVYELGDPDGDIVYIGQGRVRNRLRAHYEKSRELFSLRLSRAVSYRCEYCGSKDRAEQMERVELQAYEQQYGELPEYNRIGWLSP